MDCRQSQLLLLSSYHDSELPSEQRIELEVHLEGCPHCLKKLAMIRQLSQATRNLPAPRPPHELWDRIAMSLDGEQPRQTTDVGLRRPSSANGMATNPLTRRLFLGSLATAGVLLVGLGISWWVQAREHAAYEHDPLAQYVQEFGVDPILAQQRLTTKYQGQSVAADRAVQLVGYRPANVQPPPDGFELDALYVLDMPCCKCVEAFWRRNDDSCLAIFEHNAEPQEWFQDYPSIRIPCAGTTCRVIDLGDQLAASWPRGRRIITVVGLRDVEELSKLVTTLI